ncbi:hypothetical protein HBB16_09720 [Pseudonocardia sp. MCCB 268]|nr:hypothetical protein [Pseudonocardia cytotoxica]
MVRRCHRPERARAGRPRRGARRGHCQGRLVTSRADVSAEPEMQDAVESFAGAFGGLDGIVNNAGVGGAFGRSSTCASRTGTRHVRGADPGVFLGIKHTARIPIRQGRRGPS